MWWHRNEHQRPQTPVFWLVLSNPPPADNDTVIDWMHRRLKGTIATPLAEAAPSLAPEPLPRTQETQGLPLSAQAPRLLTLVLPPVVPQPDMWVQLTASLSQSFAQAASSFNNTSREATSSSQYKEGGRNNDEFQLAVLRGFAHTSNIAQVTHQARLRTSAHFSASVVRKILNCTTLLQVVEI